MIGSYRTLLALMVVFQHLGGLPMIGGYAVFSFYTISGYLMTLIMHETYGYTVTGIKRYALNRFLRIYPLYWVISLISLLLVVLLGNDYTRYLNEVIFLPESPKQIIQNLFIIFGVTTSPRIIPPAWALTVELFFYICIALGLSKNKTITTIWFSLSCIYTLIVNAVVPNLHYRYFAITAASMPFATGALIYYYKDNLLKMFKSLRSNKSTTILLLLIFANYILNYKLDKLMSYGFYINFILNCILFITLIGKDSLFFISKRADKHIGDLSYPCYLVHYLCGLIIIYVIGFKIKHEQIYFVLLSIPLILLVSFVINKLIEMPIEKIRKQIKLKTS